MSSIASWRAIGAVGALALLVGSTGCGGSSPPTLGNPSDGASEGATGETDGADAAMTPEGGGTSMDDSGDSATVADDSGDSATVADDSGDSAIAPGDSGDTSTTTNDAGDSAVALGDSGDSATPGTDSSTPDSAGTTDASDAGAGADSSDSAPSCGADNAACNSAGSKGLCKTAVCSACTDTTDDANCSTAYGGAYLCLAGVCAAGNCRTSADCSAAGAAGPLCGVTTANLCGKCTTDTQCAGNSAGAFCNTTTGACVSGACTGTAANPPAACPVNGADICCTTTCQAGAPAGAFSCCTGTAGAGDTYCAGKLGGAATCTNGSCTLCASGPGNAYTVDPVRGSDTTGNGNVGNGNAASCAFATIARALQVIGNSSAFAVTVTVLGPSTVPDISAETFPIAIPQNVTITTRGGAVTVNVPTGRSGFALNAPNAALSGGSGAPLTLSGQANKATYGIIASSAMAVGTKISNLTVSGFLDDGILVNGTGVLTIGAGVTSTLNGTAAARMAGMHVTGTGIATITNLPSGAVPNPAPTHFDGNSNHGILVDAAGSIVLSGSVTNATGGTGTITTNGNFAAGIWIAQRPSAAIPPLNAIRGLVSFGNTNGNGLRLFAASNVELRGSASLGNSGDGVLVSTLIGGLGGNMTLSNDISHMDLGTGPDAGPGFGNNTFQEPVGAAGHNGAAGICLGTRNNAGVLQAQGNSFGAINCAGAGGALTRNKAGCDNAACAGACDLGAIGTGNSIDPSICTAP